MSKDKKLVISLLIVVMLMAITPIFVLKDAEFGGSDDAGSVMIESIQEGYEPWFTPVLENAIGENYQGKLKVYFFVYKLPLV